MKDIDKISMTGRLCYLFMCIEQYLVNMYPDRDWIPWALKSWQWTNKFWNEGEAIYETVVPEYLFEFDNYEETNDKEFDGNLSKEDYEIFLALYDGITDGKSGDELNYVLNLPVDFEAACEGSALSYAIKETTPVLEKMVEILEKHGIEVPPVTKVEFSPMTEKNGWGNFFDSTQHSIFLREKI